MSKLSKLVELLQGMHMPKQDPVEELLEALTKTANGDCDCNNCKARRKLEEHISSNYEVKGIAVNGAGLAHAIVHNGKHNISRGNVLEGIEILGKANPSDPVHRVVKMPGVGDQMAKLVMFIKMMRLVHQYLQGIADAINTVGQNVAETIHSMAEDVAKGATHTKPEPMASLPKITATVQVMGNDLASWNTFKGIMELLRNEALGVNSDLVAFEFQEPAAKAKT